MAPCQGWAHGRLDTPSSVQCCVRAGLQQWVAQRAWTASSMMVFAHLRFKPAASARARRPPKLV